MKTITMQINKCKESRRPSRSCRRINKVSRDTEKFTVEPGMGRLPRQRTSRSSAATSSQVQGEFEEALNRLSPVLAV